MMKLSILNNKFIKSRGQATTEFVVALFVLLPMFLGVYYFARYSDVKQSAIQASRYVAFERTWDPYMRAKNDAQLYEETRARFFVPVSENQGVIKYRDTTLSLNPDSKRVSLWSDLGYKRLLQNFSDVDIRVRDVGALNTGVVGKLESIASKAFSLPNTGIIKAEVTVPLNNIANYDVLSNINIGLPGATAIGGGVWNAGGARAVGSTRDESVCARIKPTVLSDKIKFVTDVLGVLMAPFEQDTPDIGLILPDYVPPGSVRTNDAASSPRAYPQQNPNRC
jgi:TadE-like protein